MLLGLGCQGDPPRHFFILKRGVCRVVHDVIVRKTRRWPVTKHSWHTEESQTVNHTDLALLRAGTHFGEVALLSGEVRVCVLLLSSLCSLSLLHPLSS